MKDRMSRFIMLASKIRSQDHLDKIMASFHVEQQKLAIEKIGDILHPDLQAREVETLEVKPKDEQNPTIHEETAMRLANYAAQVLAQKAEIDRLKAEIKELDEKMAEMIAR